MRLRSFVLIHALRNRCTPYFIYYSIRKGVVLSLRHRTRYLTFLTDSRPFIVLVRLTPNFRSRIAQLGCIDHHRLTGVTLLSYYYVGRHPDLLIPECSAAEAVRCALSPVGLMRPSYVRAGSMQYFYPVCKDLSVNLSTAISADCS